LRGKSVESAESAGAAALHPAELILGQGGDGENLCSSLAP